MSKRNVLLASAVVGLLLVGFWAYHHFHSRDQVAIRAEMLSHLPSDPSAVVFLDLVQFRSSPFLAQLFAWAPHPAPDQDYAQFVQATGFNYEHDLDRIAVAVTRQGGNSTTFLIADGRFDRKKIEAYAARFGKPQVRKGRVVFPVIPNGSSRPSYFTFLQDDRVAWTDDPSFATLFSRGTDSLPLEWREHFDRLAGTPLFALLRPEGSASALTQQAPGGFRSPQLAALLDQLQWISVGAKPEGNVLRVVVDGECYSQNTMRQLSEMLGGILILAQGGLNDPQTRKKLDPQLREACLELVQSADVQKIDRGSSKSVRVVFDVTPKLLQTARAATPQLATPRP